VYFAAYTGAMSFMAEKYNGFYGEVTLEASDFSESDGSFDARLVTENGRSPYKLRLSNYADENAGITPGCRFDATVYLSAPENTPRFSSQRYFRADGIYLTGYVSEMGEISEKGLGFFNWHKYLRHVALERTELLYGEKAYLMKGLLFGDKSDFSESFSLAASGAGVSHIFAVSGMHLSFLVSAVLFLSRRRPIRYFAIAVVLVFMAVTGFEPSVVRAGIMQITALITWVSGRESESFGSMAFSLLVLLCFNPCSIGDIGLQFSFCAVLGILLWGEKLKRKLFEGAKRLPEKMARPMWFVVSAVAVSVSATLFTVPPAVMYFERLSLISVVSNIAMNWMVSVVFVAGALSLIVSCIWIPLGEGLAWLNSFGAAALEFFIGFFADIPFAVLGAESVFVKLALAATYGFGGFFFAKKARSAFVKTAAVFVGGVCIALGLSFALSFCGMRMTAVDSQSQCTLVCAKGKNYAVGVGGAELGTLMQNRNIGKVDLLVIPCVLEKDVSCAEELILSGRVKHLALARYSGERENAERIFSAAESKGIPVDILSCDREYLLDDNIRMNVFVPASSGEGRGACAVFVEYGSAGAFIAGEVSAKAQERLILSRGIDSADLLLLANGGSKASCSPETLELCEDGLVLISGRSRSEAEGLADKKVLRTFEMGNIDTLFFGGKIYIYN
ncbi:MAG: ComEC/Rec2 family competence protein, partial [Oscillospiraceae bacterium]|nr:ComEC/Rec2 family competence protein [Oscillospiraceae bacterium]